jgi:hypothetical protein
MWALNVIFAVTSEDQFDDVIADSIINIFDDQKYCVMNCMCHQPTHFTMKQKYV